MHIEIDESSGFCFGVTTAIRKAEEELAQAVFRTPEQHSCPCVLFLQAEDGIFPESYCRRSG